MLDDVARTAGNRDNAILILCATFIALSHIVFVYFSPSFTHRAAESFFVTGSFILLLSFPTSVLLAAMPILLRHSSVRCTWPTVVALGCFLRIAWFGSPAPIEDDFYRYLWDGAVAAHGFSPYTYAPQAFVSGSEALNDKPALLQFLAQQASEILPKINFSNLRSIYPGTAQASFALAHGLAPFSIDGLRAVYFLSEAVTALLLITLLHNAGVNRLWVAAYWCNPFMATMLVGAAHVDALIPPFLLGALFLLLRKQTVSAGLCVGLAAGVKLWPALFGLLILRQTLQNFKKLALTLLALAITGGFTVFPLLLSSQTEGSGLTAYAKDWANNNALFLWLSHLLMVVMPLETAAGCLRIVLGLTAVITAFAVAWRMPYSPVDLYRRATLLSGVGFFCSPAQFPWYASWFMPFATLSQFWPLLVLPAILPAYYLFFPFWVTPYNIYFFYGIAIVHALPPLFWLTWRLLVAQGRTQSPSALPSKS